MSTVSISQANVPAHAFIPAPEMSVEVFSSPMFGDVRVVVGVDDSHWFVAADVCAALDLGNVTEALRGLDDDEKNTLSNPEGNPRAGIPRQLNIISEPGLYSLVLRSRKPEAKAFKRWITHEVIPAIRKHGGYLTPAKIEEALLDPDTIIQLATSLKEERTRRAALETQAALDRPKVVFADSIEVSKTSILVGELAKLVKQSTGYDVGQNRMFSYLRDNGYLHKGGTQRNMPTQRSMNSGWMEIKEGTRMRSSGESEITLTTKVTGRGQVYFVNLFQKIQKGE